MNNDVKIILSRETPQNPKNLGNLAVLHVGATAIADQSFKTLTAVEIADLPADVFKVAQGFFTQEEHAPNLHVFGATTAGLVAKLEAIFPLEWEFITVVGTDAEFATVSNFLEAKNSKIAVKAVDAGPANAAALATSLNTAPFRNNAHTIVFAIGDSETAFAAGALIGALGNKKAGSINWKFKSVGGVAVTTASYPQVEALHELGVIAYVEKSSGKKQTSKGTTLSGERVQDIHFDDWVKATMESAIQNILETNDLVPYDASGIGLIESQVSITLSQGTENGGILRDSDSGQGMYSVTVIPRTAQAPADVAAGIYGGISFEYTRAGAVDSVTVRGKGAY